MSTRRDAVLVDVAPQDDGSVLLAAEPPRFSHRLSAADVAERDRLVADAERARRSSPGASYFTGDPDRDATALRTELIWSALRAWDLEHVFRPILARLDRATLVLHPGRSRLAHCSLRGALREGVYAGSIGADTLRRVRGIPYWSAPGFHRLLDRAARGDLPVVDPTRTTLLVAAPPDALASMITGAPRARWARLLRAALPDLRAARTSATFEQELFACAAALGAEVLHPATRAHLVERIAARVGGSSLFIIAHQDDEGIHLSDGVLPLGALRAAFADLIEAGAQGHDTVDLGVCGAEGPHNLADCFQEAGAPLVMTRGMTSFFGRDLAATLLVMRRLARQGPAPLPDLIDDLWIEASSGSRPQ